MAVLLSRDELYDKDAIFLQDSLRIDVSKSCQNYNCFLLDEKTVSIPFSFAHQHFNIPENSLVPTEQFSFIGTLREKQQTLCERVLNNLKNDGCSIISSQPGFGKTISAIFLAAQFQLKTLVVIGKKIVQNQWIESIQKFTTARVQCISSNTTRSDPSASFYIVNPANISKKPISFWSNCKFLIVDELHQSITAATKGISVLNIHPQLVLGLSATPYRFDGLDKCIGWIFGKVVNEIQESRHHDLIIVDTNFYPKDLKYTANGLDWNNVLTLQSENLDRNNLIVSTVCQYPTKTWLILVKRVNHAELLKSLFEKIGRQVTTLFGTTTKFDVQCKILIGTTAKIGVGFDHVAINALCIAADVKQYYIQYLGRCMRQPDSNPLVVDFRDKFQVLERHLNERIRECLKNGGIICKLP